MNAALGRRPKESAAGSFDGCCIADLGLDGNDVGYWTYSLIERGTAKRG